MYAEQMLIQFEKGFNRTKVELKFEFVDGKYVQKESFNRTKVELKFSKFPIF